MEISNNSLIFSQDMAVLLFPFTFHVSLFIYMISLFLKDTGLSLSTELHAVACCCSVVILAQVLMYWSKSMINSEKERQVEKDKAE